MKSPRITLLGDTIEYSDSGGASRFFKQAGRQ